MMPNRRRRHVPVLDTDPDRDLPPPADPDRGEGEPRRPGIRGPIREATAAEGGSDPGEDEAGD